MLRRILLVDDVTFSLEFQKNIIESIDESIEVVTASTIKEAKTAVQQKRFHIAMLDMQLPDGEGVEIAKLLKENYPDTFVAAITIYPSRYRQYEHLFDVFLAKPVKKDDFRDLLLRML